MLTFVGHIKVCLERNYRLVYSNLLIVRGTINTQYTIFKPNAISKRRYHN